MRVYIQAHREECIRADYPLLTLQCLPILKFHMDVLVGISDNCLDIVLEKDFKNFFVWRLSLYLDHPPARECFKGDPRN